MTTPVCPRLLNLINNFVLLRFRARSPEDLSAIEVIFIIIIIMSCIDRLRIPSVIDPESLYLQQAAVSAGFSVAAIF